MKARLIDFMDPNRPLAKAAMELDWTTVVALFPEAGRDGHDAARTWVLASIVILGEISGLSEGEVLSRWPENPYWQAFSGFAQFQWKAPVTQADCLAFRRYVDAPRAARLSAIAQSILQAKHLEANALEAVAPASGPSVDDALALRQLHFLQPQPPQPYKAPPRPGFQSGIKQAYARAAAPPPTAKTPASPGQDLPDQPAPAISPASPTAADPTKPSGDTDTTSLPLQPPAAEATIPAIPAIPAIPEKPIVAQFAQTYTMLVKKAAPLGIRAQFPVMDGLAAMDPTPLPGNPFAAQTPSPSPIPPASRAISAPAAPAAPQAFAPVLRGPQGAPPEPVRQTAPAGTPQFDTTAPFMRRSAPDEPVTMEVVATGDAPLHYQWETFDDIKGTATPIEGCNEPKLTVALEASDTMLAFQCRVSNGPCPQGAVSRTFFLKKAAPAPANPNSFGEKLALQPAKPGAQAERVR
jgi:hypothetical protein